MKRALMLLDQILLASPWRRHSCLPRRDSSRRSSSRIKQTPARVPAQQTKSPRHDSFDVHRAATVRERSGRLFHLLLLSAMIPAPGILFADEQESVHKTFAGAKSIEIDNVYGSIHVSGYDGAEIQLDAHKTLTADNTERAEAAKRDVKLDITQSGESVRVYVDGPFRCHCEDRPSFRSRNNMNEHGRRGYKVVYDFDLKVPRGTALYLGTVNEGRINVEKTAGDFDIENINGGVQMDEIGGSGRVYALNGKVAVTFARNPERNSYFGSLNGAVDVWFQPNLSADARVKTFNGGIYTDFPVTYLPAAAGTGERKNGKFVYRNNEFQGVRIGNGGPEYKFENFNGDIRIRNRGQK
jgi:hypothetical protein